MKIIDIFLIIALTLFVSIASLSAGADKNEDGTYKISGKWTFWAEKSLLAPTGQENDFGEFKTVLFKTTVNDFQGVRELKQSEATFVVKARESTTEGGDKILVVEEILSREP